MHRSLHNILLKTKCQKYILISPIPSSKPRSFHDQIHHRNSTDQNLNSQDKNVTFTKTQINRKHVCSFQQIGAYPTNLNSKSQTTRNRYQQFHQPPHNKRSLKDHRRDRHRHPLPSPKIHRNLPIHTLLNNNLPPPSPPQRSPRMHNLLRQRTIPNNRKTNQGKCSSRRSHRRLGFHRANRNRSAVN